MSCKGGGRPRGDLRRLLVLVFGQAAEALTWRDAAAALVAGGHAPSLGASELQIIRRTVANMASAGELQRAHEVRRLGSKRPMTAFRLARPEPGQLAPEAERWASLAAALRPSCCE